MATQLVKAWFLNELERMILEFNNVIDISAWIDYSKIQVSPDNGTTEPTITAAAIDSVSDSKYVWVELNSGAITTIGTWSAAQKQTLEIELTTGAFTDINGVSTGATAYSDNIRCQYIYESSLSATWDAFSPSVDDYLHLPPATTIISDDLTHNLAESIITWRIKGRGETSVLSGGLAFSNRGEASASNPIVMEVEDCFIDGNINVQPGDVSNSFLENEINIAAGEYLAVKFTVIENFEASAISITSMFSNSAFGSAIFELRADNTGVPSGSVLATTSSTSIITSSASYSLNLTTNPILTGATSYWCIIKNTGSTILTVRGSTAQPASSRSTSSDGTSWAAASAGGFSFALESSTQGLPLSLKITNCTINGAILENGTTGRWAGFELDDSSYASIFDRCTLRLSETINNKGYSPWSFINSIIDNESSESITDENLTMSYCNCNLNFSSGKAYNSNVSSGIIPDNDNSSGLSGFALVDTQGQGWVSGAALNMGKALTVTPLGTDSPAERAIGIPKGAACAVGANNTKPAQSLTITSATVSGNQVTLTYTEDVESGDIIRGILNNIESTTGQLLAQGSQFTDTVA